MELRKLLMHTFSALLAFPLRTLAPYLVSLTPSEWDSFYEEEILQSSKIHLTHKPVTKPFSSTIRLNHGSVPIRFSSWRQIFIGDCAVCFVRWQDTPRHSAPRYDETQPYHYPLSDDNYSWNSLHESINQLFVFTQCPDSCNKYRYFANAILL